MKLELNNIEKTIAHFARQRLSGPYSVRYKGKSFMVNNKRAAEWLYYANLIYASEPDMAERFKQHAVRMENA